MTVVDVSRLMPLGIGIASLLMWAYYLGRAEMRILKGTA
jgi:hypothetical protein